MQLLGLNTQEMETALREMGESAFRGRQITEWLYQRGATSFDEMTNLSRDLQSRLATQHELLFPEIAARHVSRDGSTKLLLKMADGERIETVRLPYPERLSVCVSSQAGCAVGCVFCATGLGGFRRNLRADEIIAQPLLAMTNDDLRVTSEHPDSSIVNRKSSLTHVVFMGMGEPLLNFANVLKSIYLMHDEIGIPMRNITVSTVGILPGIEKLAAEKLQLTLAVSLHAPFDELRHQLIPTSTKTSVNDIVSASRHYARHTGRRVTFEYVLLGGINDQLEHARRLAKLCAGWPCHVNVIPWNPVPGATFEGQVFDAPTSENVRQFRGTLEAAGIAVTQRVQRGADVAAACGQLRAKSEAVKAQA